MKNTVVALVLCIAGLALSGCGAANPRTKITAGFLGSGFTFYDNKDNDISIKHARWGDAELEDLVIRNNASDVRLANVQQLIQINEQIRIHGENINRALGIIGELLPRVIPGLKISTPLGSAAATAEVVDAIGKALPATSVPKAPPAPSVPSSP